MRVSYRLLNSMPETDNEANQAGVLPHLIQAKRNKEQNFRLAAVSE
jgi:hypothetical protein